QQRLVGDFCKFLAESIFSGRPRWLFGHRYPPTTGGVIPWKKIHEIARPIQIMKPNRLTTYTTASRPMPSSQSFLKLAASPIEKNVMTKKSVRNTSLSLVAS